MAEVVENYTLAEIPLETVVVDTEAWSSNEIFTLSDGYPLPSFQNFVDRLHRNGQRWVGLTAFSVAIWNKACSWHLLSLTLAIASATAQCIATQGHSEANRCMDLRDSGFLSRPAMSFLQFPIVDPQTHIRQGYPPHDSGIQEDIFIKDVTGQPFVGQVPKLN